MLKNPKTVPAKSPAKENPLKYEIKKLSLKNKAKNKENYTNELRDIPTMKATISNRPAMNEKKNQFSLVRTLTTHFDRQKKLMNEIKDAAESL